MAELHGREGGRLSSLRPIPHIPVGFTAWSGAGGDCSAPSSSPDIPQGPTAWTGAGKGCSVPSCAALHPTGPWTGAGQGCSSLSCPALTPHRDPEHGQGMEGDVQLPSPALTSQWDPQNGHELERDVEIPHIHQDPQHRQGMEGKLSSLLSSPDIPLEQKTSNQNPTTRLCSSPSLPMHSGRGLPRTARPRCRESGGRRPCRARCLPGAAAVR